MIPQRMKEYQALLGSELVAIGSTISLHFLVLLTSLCEGADYEKSKEIAIARLGAKRVKAITDQPTYSALKKQCCRYAFLPDFISLTFLSTYQCITNRDCLLWAHTLACILHRTGACDFINVLEAFPDGMPVSEVKIVAWEEQKVRHGEKGRAVKAGDDWLSNDEFISYFSFGD